MSQTSDEAATESGFNTDMNRVWHVRDARQELATQSAEDNMLRATRDTVQRQRRGGRMSGYLAI